MPGMPGLLTGIGIFLVWYAIAWKSIKPCLTYSFEPRGPGSFEPILARYSRLTEFIVGLATSSIVLLAGSSVFRSGGKLPKVYGSPLVLLALSVVCAVMFIACSNYNYEEWQHHGTYSHHRYRVSLALGFSSLLCFAVGHCWLAFALVRD
jgi:hypothetical protein